MQLDSSLYRPVLHAKTGNTVMALLVPLIKVHDGSKGVDCTVSMAVILCTDSAM